MRQVGPSPSSRHGADVSCRPTATSAVSCSTSSPSQDGMRCSISPADEERGRLPTCVRRRWSGWAWVTRRWPPLNPSIIYCGRSVMVRAGRIGKAVYDDLMQSARRHCSACFGRVDGTPQLCAGQHLRPRRRALPHRSQSSARCTIARVPAKGSRSSPDVRTMAESRAGRPHGRRRVLATDRANMGYKRLLSTIRGPYPTLDGHLSWWSIPTALARIPAIVGQARC